MCVLQSRQSRARQNVRVALHGIPLYAPDRVSCVAARVHRRPRVGVGVQARAAAHAAHEAAAVIGQAEIIMMG